MAVNAKGNIILGLEENVACAVCYIPALGVLPAIVFLVAEKNEKVRWNAVQSLILWAAVMAADVVLGVSIIGAFLIPLVNLVGIIVIPLILAIRANQKEQTRLPFAGELTDALLKSHK